MSDETNVNSRSAHYLIRCSCGAVIMQCRCPGPKYEEVQEKGCVACKHVQECLTNTR